MSEDNESSAEEGLSGIFTGELTIEQVLQELRRRLLDLTARNRLLNFRHSQTKTIQIVDAVPNAVYDRLMDGRSLTFIPVPDPRPSEYEGEGRRQKPEVREYAKQLGIPTNYELGRRSGSLPARGNEGLKLRVLAYPEDTERLCRRISKDARSSIEETGTNMLYLVLGFLEFYEAPQSDRTLLAPLIAVPVNIKKGAPDRESRLPLYEITYTGDEVADNLSLREKLRVEFAMELPALGEDFNPEEFFSQVEDAIATRPRWKVRRQLTLALLSFARMLLVNDLDPKNWPQGRHRSALQEHRLLRTVFGDLTPDDGAGSEPDDYDIDNHPNSNLALIYDADTSQHSALIDALDGKNLVVNGPPGTGKSQTITNLIAEALLRGKKILFVSDKLAALQVVKNRLEQAKLGHFCLELHSHKTQKKRFLDDLSARQHARFVKPSGLDGKLQLLEQQRKQLQAYADLMNSKIGNELGLTVFEILWRGERRRQEAGGAAETLNGIVVTNAPNCEHAHIGRMAADIETLARHFAEIDNYGATHPWFGFSPTELRPGDDLDVQTALLAITESAHAVDLALRALHGITADAELPTTMAAQTALAIKIRHLPAPAEGVQPDLLPKLFNDGSGTQAVAVVNGLKARVAEAQRLLEESRGKLNRNLDVSEESVQAAKSWTATLSQLGVEGYTLSALVACNQEISGLIDGASNSLTFFAELASLLSRAQEQTDTTLRKLAAILQVCFEAPRELLEYRLVSFSRPSTKELAAKASAEAIRLLAVRDDLDALLYIDEKPDEQEIAITIQTFREGDAWYRVFQGRWRRARKFYQALARDRELPPSDNCAQTLGAFAQNIRDLSLFRNNSQYREVFGRLFNGDETDYGKINRLIGWYEGAQAHFAAAALSPEEFDVTVVDSFRVVQLADRSALGHAHLKALSEALNRIVALTQRSSFGREIQGAQSPWTKRIEAASAFGAEIEAGARFLKAIGPDALSASVITQALAAELVLRKTLDSIEQDEKVKTLIGAYFRGLDTDFKPVDQTLSWGKAIVSSQLPDSIQTLLLSAQGMKRLAEIKTAGRAIDEAWIRVNSFSDRMKEVADFDERSWNASICTSPGEETTDAIRTRSQHALDNMEQLLPWSQYLNAREVIVEHQLGAFAEKLEANDVHHSLLLPGFLHCFYGSIAQSLFRRHSVLSRFSGMTHSQVRGEFARLDREIVTMRGAECASRIASNAKLPEGNAAARVEDRTEMELLRHLTSLQRPRTPIRQMMKRAGQAIQALKPCFMMGPLAVAQYLEPGAVSFDLVIMDEASQLKPEEAIGAVARGAQLVVVGDPKQLPPTSFFDRMMNVQDDGDDSQASVVTSSESVLDLCIPVFPHRTLKWHYRSKHESLIAFSNARFYDGSLFVFPSPFPKTMHLGLRYRYVANGVYQNRQNIPEARRVVDAVLEHMQTRPDESLGVVTLNITQRDLIEELLEQRLRSVEFGEQYRTRWEEEGWPFFVKNLENVQGDERDVILISTTFGKAPNTNVVHQNFGPITKANGWRRLNVLFTRARRSLHIYSSMQPEDIVVDGTTPRGTAELRGYLEYASRGVLGGTTFGPRPPDSDFEIAVINMLLARGYEVQPQLGVAKFFIDIAVRNPDRPGEFMAAIECDGATYHSGVSVRDRDRIRQEILESLGWKDRIWRIWSTDWFRNPQREIAKLVEFLEKRREVSANEPVPLYDKPEPPLVTEPQSMGIPATAVVPGAIPTQTVLVESELPFLEIEGVGEDEDLYVEVGDKIIYVDLDAPEEKSNFRIVSDGHMPTAGLINEAKPIAQAFLGAVEGETVEMKLEGRPVKHFKLLKIERVLSHVN